MKSFVLADYLTKVSLLHWAVIFENENDTEAFNKPVLQGRTKGLLSSCGRPRCLWPPSGSNSRWVRGSSTGFWDLLRLTQVVLLLLARNRILEVLHTPRRSARPPCRPSRRGWPRAPPSLQPSSSRRCWNWQMSSSGAAWRNWTCIPGRCEKASPHWEMTQQRLEFANQYQHWATKERKLVMFSNKSHFELHFASHSDCGRRPMGSDRQVLHYIT